MWVFITACLRSLVAQNALLSHCVDPELTWLQLPFIRMVLATGYMSCASLLFENGVVFNTSRSFEEMRFFLNSLIFLTKCLLCQIFHLFLQIFIQEIFWQSSRAIDGIRLPVCLCVHFSAIDLVVIYF